MSPRRSGLLVLVAAALVAACKDVSQSSPQNEIVVAVFASPNIPTPNDLALQAVPTLPTSAQKDLLQAFVTAGGFPADQAPTLSVPLKAYEWNAATSTYDASSTAPAIDPATLTDQTVALYKVDVSPPVRVEVQPAATQPAGAINLVAVADDTGSRRLAAGRYVFAVRGGAQGAKTLSGTPISADLPVALTIPNKDLSNPANQPPGGLTSDQLAQLVPVQTVLWSPLTWTNAGGLWHPSSSPSVTPAYTAIDPAFPHAEVASIAAFAIAPATGQTFPAVDAASGEAPLPIDLLRTGPSGTIALNEAFGAAAEGLTTLDGFSTTAMILAPVITPGSAVSAIDASTVDGRSVFLFKLSGGSAERLSELKAVLHGADPAPPKYVAEPTPIVVPSGTGCPIAGGCSSVIGLQPAVNANPSPSPGALGPYLPPLDESSTYAVVITNGVKDLAGNALGRPTIMTLLLDDKLLVHPVTGESLVGGVDKATATVLQQMRTDLAPALAALPGGKTTDDVVLAYTFKTQSITPTALQIAALPYSGAGAAAVQGTPTFLTRDQVAGADQYGFTLAASVAEVAEVKLNTTSLLLASQNSGAFDPVHPAPEVVTALVALPNAAAVTGTCPPGRGFTAAHCAPLVVFRHGITRSKTDVLAVAGALTQAGFIVAGIDAEKHGDRSWCTADNQCAAGSTCAFKANFTSPTDAGVPIGVCESSAGVRGNYVNLKLGCTSAADPGCIVPKGIPLISANYLVSLNFFRTRDSLRQDIIDQSALVKALAPTTQPATMDAFEQHLKDTYDIAVDPTKVFWLSQSLGSIQGGVDLAVNPRFSRAVFNVPGATVVDIFANPESGFHARLLQLLAPVQENTAEYLQLLQVAKWILDPADPTNFNRYVLDPTLHSPLNDAGIPFPTREVLVQAALCDGTIPNAQNAFFASQLGITVPAPGAGTTGRFQWYLNGASGAACPGNAATHGFLFDLVHPTLTGQAQATAVGFLASPADVPATVR